MGIEGVWYAVTTLTFTLTEAPPLDTIVGDGDDHAKSNESSTSIIVMLVIIVMIMFIIVIMIMIINLLFSTDGN
jgi:hypothetical protein